MTGGKAMEDGQFFEGFVFRPSCSGYSGYSGLQEIW